MHNWNEIKDENNESCFINKNGICVKDRNIACNAELEKVVTEIKAFRNNTLQEDNQLDIQTLGEIEDKEPSMLTDDDLINDKAILTRIVLTSKKREEKVSNAFKKDKPGTLKSIKKKITSSASKAVNFIVPPSESASLGYVEEKVYFEKISSQIKYVENELKGIIADPKKAKECIKRKVDNISNKYLPDILKLLEQIKEESQKPIAKVNFTNISEWSSQAKILVEERESKLYQFQNPEKWLVEVLKNEKMTCLEDCIQAHLEEQLVTFKAIALGTVSRKSDNIEKLAKLAHVGTKVSITITELAAVGMVPGIGALGFISMAMSVGRGALKFYKDRKILLQSKKILNICGRRLEDIVDFSKKFSKLLAAPFKNQIAHFSFSSITFLSQVLVGERIPWIIKLKDIPESKDEIIKTLTNVIIPEKYLNKLNFFDKIVSSFSITTEEGHKLNSIILLRKSSYKSRKSPKDNWEYAIPMNEEDRKISIQLECLSINSFRVIPYDQFESLFRYECKLKYLKYNEDGIQKWKDSFKKKEFEQDKTQFFHSKKLQDALNYSNMAPEYRNKSRSTPNVPPSSGTSLYGLIDDCYGQYIQMEAIYNCIQEVTANSGDTEADVFSILGCVAAIVPDRAVSKAIATGIVETVSNIVLD